MENQPMTGGRRWFRLGSVAQLNAPVQGTTQAPTTPAPGQGPALSWAPPAQATAPRIPLSGLPSERAPALPQPQPPPPPPQTQQTRANNVVNGTRALQQPTPPSPNPRTPAQPPPPPPSPRSTIMARPLTPQPPESPNPRARTWPPTPTSESPRTRNPSPPPPPESPKVIKTLTPPYPEPEPKPEPTTNHKTAFMQQGSSNSSVKTIADINGKQQGNSNQSHIDARSPPRPKFITMAGENMGAYMELGSPSGQHVNRKQHHGYFLQHQNKGIEPESEREYSTNKKKETEKMSANEGKPMVALVNSNVQSVNNSIIFRSSCTQQSPGVRETIISRRQPKHKGTPHQ